ncbi:thiamine pyrophosphate-binding protein [Actinomadura vinacea]|uniref:Thiamine pyrophosphate-binding protein n=1 Tax=Actinomadura vinacea TaxID=115336 RepID=A0ABN3K6C1_9ACTN
MLFHEAIAWALSDHGVTTVFGVLGDANLYAMDSFQRQAGGKFVSMSNEAGAVLAANGYARTSGRLGVATVTHGPALTNTVTALVESVRDRTPVLLIAGDTAVVDRENFQNISQRDVVVPTGAGFEQVRAPWTVDEDLATAVRRAVLERRPVVLNMPVDFQWEQVERSPAPRRWPAPQAVLPDPAVMDEAVGVVASAKRPIILAGRGAAAPDARKALLHLAGRIGAPVATTLRARDLFRDEPHDLGIFGTLSDEVALDTIMRSDCVIAFGASLNKWTTAEGSALEGKKLVQVDLDRVAPARHSGVHVGVVGDAATVAEDLVTWLDEADVRPTGFASPELAERLAARSGQDFKDRGTDATVDIRTALMRLESTFPKERTLVFDGGRFIHHAFRLLRVPEPSAYVHTVNFGSIGLGMGNAVGAAFGEPARPVLLVTGDGGFMLGGLAEFGSAVRHGLDLVVVVLNDGAYGAEHIQLRNKDMDPEISTFEWPDFGPVATALGGQGFTVRDRAELDEALAAIEHRDRPVLIDIKIDPDAVPAVGR